jgi:hypothetical protein
LPPPCAAIQPEQQRERQSQRQSHDRPAPASSALLGFDAPALLDGPPRRPSLDHSPFITHHSPPSTAYHPPTVPPAFASGRFLGLSTALLDCRTLPLPLPFLMTPRLLCPRLPATALPSLCTCSISIAQDAARARNHSSPGPPSPLAPCRLTLIGPPRLPSAQVPSIHVPPSTHASHVPCSYPVPSTQHPATYPVPAPNI